MARRKSKAKQEEEFFQGLAGIASLALATLGFTITHSLFGAVVGLVIGLVIVISVMNYIGNKRTERLKRSGIADIDKMEGVQFEKYLGHLFRAQGYKAEVTKAAGDYGADLLLQKDGKKIVVQAKRYSKNVGIKAVQEAQASIAHYGAAEAWVVSNRDYTQAAYDLARSNHVRLINREALIEMILAMNPGAAPSPKAVIAEMPVDELTCPKCGSKLVLLNGPKGQFYGCSSFPKCRHIKSTKAV
ncbi:restriction endonuclease [Paenibacillus sp. HN-1]|uniref:restriction endonuclease n=1 Tax=Paenibacillus TaxID=44249 RepID=UPI001CA9CD59|nr:MULTISPECIES: restriction endonuclease [Paenibacillus]MBY9081014.1 restriction endonuclease [Paenibacillus sp. CGMCC 1.18879]MBY9087616.1 restriction endonuclease [Paenibacillus sinensis]